jgi:sulfoxide reductase heme-binding subunit YedZ
MSKTLAASAGRAKLAQPKKPRKRLLANSRFWIVASAVTLAVNIAGFTQLFTLPGSLQTIRIGQYYGLMSLALLYFTLLISPLTIVFPLLSFKNSMLFARRGFGISAFYFALAHFFITFFGQLGGPSGIKYYDELYGISLLAGAIALGILLIMALTPLDTWEKKLSYKSWKMLHRSVYIAGLAIIVHINLIGPSYASGLTIIGVISYLLLAGLLFLEALRFRHFWKNRKRAHA